MILNVNIRDFRIEGKDMMGDLEYIPYHIFVDDYKFQPGDVIVDDGNECYIEMDDDKLFDIAYVL